MKSTSRDALMLGLLLSSCPNQTAEYNNSPRSVEIPEEKSFDLAIGTKRKSVGTAINIFLETPSLDTEVSVDTSGILDEEGHIELYFDFVGVLQDCVEGSGEYICSREKLGSTCYLLNPEKNTLPFVIEMHYSMVTGFEQTGIFDEKNDYIVSQKMGAKVRFLDSSKEWIYEFDIKNPDEPEDIQEELTEACQDAIEFGHQPQREAMSSEELAAFELGKKGPELYQAWKAIYEALKDSGLQAKEEGGNIFSIEVPGGMSYEVSGVINMYNEDFPVVYRVVPKMYTLKNSGDCQLAEMNFMNTAEEVVDAIQGIKCPGE